MTRELVFFNEAEGRAVEALAARILPGDADDPGAREASLADLGVERQDALTDRGPRRDGRGRGDRVPRELDTLMWSSARWSGPGPLSEAGSPPPPANHSGASPPARQPRIQHLRGSA